MSMIPVAVLTLAMAAGEAPQASRYFTIEVVDAETGRGVPLVELRTVLNVRYYTDSAGIVAFYEPGLMDRRVFFYVESHGYEFPADGFGYRGKALDVVPGGSARLKINRLNVAERLYRVTGAGIYRDSVLAGRPVPIREPLLNAQVTGSDGVLSDVYRGKIYWFWGDTNRPSYPLGNFHTPGATSLLPDQGRLDPEVGVNLAYFVDANGFAKETAHMPGEGPTWLDGLTVLCDADGRERLFARYVKVRKPMVVYEQGLVEFDPKKQAFEKVLQMGMDAPVCAEGHPLRHTVDGVDYVYFAQPFPLVRVRADPEHFQDLASYEALTCLQEGTRLDDARLDRDSDGKLRFRWKKNTPAVRLEAQIELVKEGHLREDEALPHLRDVESGKILAAHRGSVYWNDYRRRWVMIANETFGTSMLGEVWYAEADTPEGPWAYARKIVTHREYSFYNPKQHPVFSKEGGRIIFFEGTYSHSFSGNADQTPRYDYNQVMYKLDLADPRLVLPVAVYRLDEEEGPDRFATADRLDRPGSRPVAFFACDRQAEGMLPLYAVKTPTRATVLRASPEDLGPKGRPPDDPQGPSPDAATEPLFYALPAEMPSPPESTVPLYEHVHADGDRVAYRTGDSPSPPGYRRVEPAVCRVWRDPTATAHYGPTEQ